MDRPSHLVQNSCHDHYNWPLLSTESVYLFIYFSKGSNIVSFVFCVFQLDLELVFIKQVEYYLQIGTISSITQNKVCSTHKSWYDLRSNDINSNLSTIDNFFRIQDSIVIGGWKQYKKSEYVFKIIEVGLLVTKIVCPNWYIHHCNTRSNHLQSQGHKSTSNLKKLTIFFSWNKKFSYWNKHCFTGSK